MRRILLCVLLVLLLTACSGAKVDASESVPNTEPTIQTTEPPTTEPPATQPPTEPTLAEPTDCKFRQKVKHSKLYIYKEPQHDAKIARVLPKGVYTIVKETYDASGNHWGKLKSGAGWICLTDIQENRIPVEIEQAKKSFLNEGEYTKHGKVSGKYTIAVRVHATQTLTDIAVYKVDHLTDKKTGSALVQKDALEKDANMVMWLEFPGDFDTYEIRFTGEAGTRYKYQIGENLSGEGELLSFWLVK